VSTFENDLRDVIKRHGRAGETDTYDGAMAAYLSRTLAAAENLIRQRDRRQREAARPTNTVHAVTVAAGAAAGYPVSGGYARRFIDTLREHGYVITKRNDDPSGLVCPRCGHDVVRDGGRLVEPPEATPAVCRYCPDEDHPDPANHPGGQPQHVNRKCWICGGNVYKNKPASPWLHATPTDHAPILEPIATPPAPDPKTPDEQPQQSVGDLISAAAAQVGVVAHTLISRLQPVLDLATSEPAAAAPEHEDLPDWARERIDAGAALTYALYFLPKEMWEGPDSPGRQLLNRHGFANALARAQRAYGIGDGPIRSGDILHPVHYTPPNPPLFRLNLPPAHPDLSRVDRLYSKDDDDGLRYVAGEPGLFPIPPVPPTGPGIRNRGTIRIPAGAKDTTIRYRPDRRTGFKIEVPTELLYYSNR
jgi:hypothetical protein